MRRSATLFDALRRIATLRCSVTLCDALGRSGTLCGAPRRTTYALIRSARTTTRDELGVAGNRFLLRKSRRVLQRSGSVCHADAAPMASRSIQTPETTSMTRTPSESASNAPRISDALSQVRSVREGCTVSVMPSLPPGTRSSSSLSSLSSCRRRRQYRCRRGRRLSRMHNHPRAEAMTLTSETMTRICFT